MRQVFGIMRAAATAIFVITGCSDEPLARVTSMLVADPDTLDVGEGCLGEVTVATVTLRNEGRGRAEVVETRLEGEEAFVVNLPADRIWAPGMSREVEVEFRPVDPARVHTATVVLVDDDGGELVLPVRGTGGLRRIEAAPAQVDFGVVDEGSPARRTVLIRNAGGSPLSVASVVLTSTSPELGLEPGAFSGGLLPAKSEVSIDLFYDPQDRGEDAGVLWVASDDPNTPQLQVPVRGQANLRPKVDLWACRGDRPREQGCALSARRPQLSVGIDEVVHLDARDARDPEGGPLTWIWSVPDRPEGSLAGVFPGGADTGDLLIDRLGSYRVAVRVLDARGLESTPSEVALTPKDLVITLDWDRATDVDLHLIRPGGEVGSYGNGVPGRSVGSDCSTFNRAPNWGDPSRSDDDPRLERDAVTSAGVEVVGLDHLEAGEYAVFAHHCDSRETRTQPRAELTVTSRGQSVSAGVKADLPSGALWRAGTVRWDSSAASAVFEATLPLDVVSRPGLCRTN